MPFPKEAEDREEDRELPNSRAIIEANLDENPLTLGFDSQMPQAKDVELPNSCTIVAVGLDEIPSTSGVDFEEPCLPITKVNPFHVIFDLNRVLIATQGSHTVIFHPGLKEFLEKCLSQFQVYIWSTTQCHNIYNYLNHIWHKTKIFIHVSKVLDKGFYMRNPYFLAR